MDIQQILSQRLDDLRAELAAIRHRLDMTDRRLDTLDRRVDRPPYPPGAETEWWWWLPFLAIAASIPLWIFAAVIVRLVRPC